MLEPEKVQNKWRLPDLSFESPVIDLLIMILFFSGLGLSIWSGNSFRRECGKPLKLAFAASTIEIAKQQLLVVIAGCKKKY